MEDFRAHNEEQAEVWRTFREGNPVRMPMLLSFNPRMWLLDPRYSRGVTFEQYYNDPDIMLEVQLRGEQFFRQTLWQDWEMGEPDPYRVHIDFQNDTECSQLGAVLRYSKNNVPFTVPFLKEDNKRQLFEQGFPDPFAGLCGRAFEYRERMQEKIRSGYLWNGRPIDPDIPVPGLSTDGPMTIACMIRGTTEFCIDLFEDPDYADELLNFITENAIRRIRAFRKRLGIPERTESFGFADDSILLLSAETYKERILPYHRKLMQALTFCDENGRPVNRTSIHLCGDATRHFRTIRDELNCYTFDTGFPVKHGELLKELGPEVTLYGGVHVDLLRQGTPEQVYAETVRIIEEVRPFTRKFVMKEANNLAPCTPMENIRAMYEAVRTRGRY